MSRPEFSWPPAWRAAGLAAVAVASVLAAGCASGPSSTGSRTGAASPRMPSPGTRHPDRDGAPSDAPPDLASLPDPVPQVEAIRTGGPNKPYAVLGQSYEPATSDIPWKETGIASWYGTKFHGRRTASGEMFSMYGLTAAHRTLPIPSYARVRNVANGKETIVRINDRGPFHSSRVMDLSYAAAVKLGIASMGSAPVEIERLTFDQIRTGAWRRTGPQAEPGTLAAAPSILQATAPPNAGDPDPLLVLAEGRQGGANGHRDGHQDGLQDGLQDGQGPQGATQATFPANATDNASHNAVAAAGLSEPTAADTPRASSAARQPAPMQDTPSRAYTAAAKGFWVQLAALGRRDGVDKLQQRVAAELSALMPMLAVFQEASYFKLQVGPYRTRSEAQAAAQQARVALSLSPLVVERR